jgi:hypothetical protein
MGGEGPLSATFNPVTSSQYHRHRTESLLDLMKKHKSLSGKIVDYCWRDGFQQRAMPQDVDAVGSRAAEVRTVVTWVGSG